VTYPDKLTARLYLSQKFVRFTLPSSGSAQNIQYRTNTKLNLGIGATFHNLSLSIFYGFGFLNNNNNTVSKGITKGLDIQFHLYPRKWAIDLVALFPKGYYIAPKGYAAVNSNSYYYRPDVIMDVVGLSAYRVPDKQKFSYRAAMVQNEWQKKSAGSLLFGGEAYYGVIKGDSALVPKQIQSGFPQAGINNISFFRIGPGIGGAYTLVIKKHFFIMGSLVANLDLDFSSEEIPTAKNKKVALSPAAVYKGAIGYNSSTWAISAWLAGNAFFIKGASSSLDYFSPLGGFRIALTKKLGLRKHHGV
jgi:hypothetical protein